MRFTFIILKQFFIIFIFIYFVECKNFKIVGGKAASIIQFPFQVIYYNNGDFACSGSLISRQFVLTAAHCTFFYSSKISLRLGSANRDHDGITANVVKYYSHPNYNPKTYDYDAAILKLSNPVKLSRNVQIARLPKEGEILSIGTECTVSGWGLKGFNDFEDPPEHLQMATVKITDFQKCRSSYMKHSYYLTDRMFCAGVIDGSQDACLGDSVSSADTIGGPIVCNDILYGVVSFGFGCGEKDYPGIYTNISLLMPWIRKISQLPFPI